MNNEDVQKVGNNQRIFKNTMMLYIRQIIIMIVGLYTSRLVLNALGTDDYGIYQVVGGFVAMFNIISGAFTAAITRFMSHEYASQNSDDIKNCYSTSLMIQVFLGAVISILISTVGVWYVRNIMVLPEGRTNDAMIVLLFSAITFFISLVSTPFNALIIANERMQAFAYIGLAEAVVKMLIALIIFKIANARLIVYGALMMLSSLMVLLLYIFYCKRYFKECKFVLKIDRTLLKNMFGFIGWAFLGNGSVVIKNQGVNMVLNYFGGTTVNAARGVANSVNNAVLSFSNNFTQAVQPQITKLCSANQKKKMIDLVCMSTKCSYFLMLIFCIPILKNLRYILHLWLGYIPDFTVSFLTFTLLESLVQSLGNPMLYGILATGKIRTYEILLSIIYILSLPLSYIVLKQGAPMIGAYVVTLTLTTAVHFLLVIQSKMTYGYSLKDYLLRVMLRVAGVTVPASLIAYFVDIPIENGFLNLVVETAFSMFVTALCILAFGINKDERNMLVGFIKDKFLHHANNKE